MSGRVLTVVNRVLNYLQGMVGVDFNKNRDRKIFRILTAVMLVRKVNILIEVF